MFTERLERASRCFRHWACTGKQGRPLSFLSSCCSLHLMWTVCPPWCVSVWHLHWYRDSYGLVLLRSLSVSLSLLHYFRAVLGSQQNWEDGTEIAHIAPEPTHAKLPLLTTFLTKIIYLLQLMSLLWHIIMTQNPVSIRIHSASYVLWVWRNV